jgi:hypothetical protein
MITGNHDCYYKDTSEVNSLSILKGWNNITILDSVYRLEDHQNDKCITFCPWGTKISDIQKSDIIFGHFECRHCFYYTYFVYVISVFSVIDTKNVTTIFIL